MHNFERAVGQPLPDKEVAVLDDHGAEVPVGAPGELCIRGGVMWGYWGQPAKADEAIHGGWLHTGDLGTMDADGYVSTLGRWSERITRAERRSTRARSKKRFNRRRCSPGAHRARRCAADDAHRQDRQDRTAGPVLDQLS